MSFASDTKTELCKSTDRPCCRKAECYGMLLFGRSFSPAGISLTTENQGAARRAAELSAEATGAIMDVTSVQLRRRGGIFSYTVSSAGSGQAEKAVHVLGHTGKEISLHINLANLENECCHAAFLRGAFLTCGTVTAPESGYRLEFTVPYMNLANDLSSLIRDILVLDLEPHVSRRKGAFVVYLKGGEHVSDFLTYIGAPEAAMALMQVRMLKNLRNEVNRKTNFEAANIEKTASAAAQESIAIKKIRRCGKLSAMPEDLKPLAALRLRYPEMSLRDLGQRLSPPLSRSGVHHRLQRILEYAEKLKVKK